MKKLELKQIIREEVKKYIMEATPEDYTGDVSVLKSVIKVKKQVDYWVKGTSKDGKYFIGIKVYSEPSTFGIKKGRVSKLYIQDADKRAGGKGFGSNLALYDRGWDTKPVNNEIKNLVNQIVKALK